MLTQLLPSSTVGSPASRLEIGSGHSRRPLRYPEALPARAPLLASGYASRAVAVLGEKGGLPHHRYSSPRCLLPGSSARSTSSKREVEVWLPGAVSAAHADVPNDRTCRALAACRLARCLPSVVFPLLQRHYVCWYMRAEGHPHNVEHTILPEHVVSQEAGGPDVARAGLDGLGPDDLLSCGCPGIFEEAAIAVVNCGLFWTGDQARGLAQP